MTTRFYSTARWQKLRLRILERDGWVCQICGQPIRHRGRGRMSAVVDHRIPVSLGGDRWDPANLRAAHQLCNLRRGHDTWRHNRRRRNNYPPPPVR